MTPLTLEHPHAQRASRLPVKQVTLRLTDRRGRLSAVSLPVDLADDAVFEGKLGPLRFEVEVRALPELQRVRLAVTVHNPRRARHKGGLWDLGDPGSVLVRELSLEVAAAADGPHGVEWLEAPGGEARRTDGRLEIYQESSGGENWNSRNHVNREGQAPMAMRGYRVCADADERTGPRANPVVAMVSGEQYVACALEEFWQQFPSAIEVSDGTIRVSFWPRQFPDLHELQAGEQNTRVVWLQFGDAEWRTLEQVHDAPGPKCDRDELIASRIVSFLPPGDSAPRSEFRILLSEALEGDRSFFAKREAIDEYGWRNFGDMWADHEEAYCDDPRPVISHYNNQYDLLYGLLVQYVLTDDSRWWKLADPLARHVMDIDIYHTDRDKPAYNGGLFWHTNHYHDAGRCTHRSHSASMLGKSQPAAGGGPGNEHNYSSGLLLYHHLTGSRRARKAVLSLADWVIAMDDGRQHVLGIVSDAPTGNATATTQTDYHGPGRGAGNSINALLDAWRLTDDARYIRKVEDIVHRTIHPQDDIAARDLLNAELRWSYTIYLQSLFKLLHWCADREELATLCEYVRRAILHYARWMAANEVFYLDRPEQLEFPTETWAAQELRKGTTLMLAAGLCDGDESVGMRRRGQEILDEAWDRLMRFPTRAYTRPLALVLQQGYIDTWLASVGRAIIGQEGRSDAPLQNGSFGNPRRFQTQKQHIRGGIKSPRTLTMMLARMAHPKRWSNIIRQSWLFESLRRLR